MKRPLQNRVSPDGEILAVAQRGTFTGNRGIIHDPRSRTLLRKRWSTRAWIICALEFGDRHRVVMSPATWTELFFLDEVTALAAGHRPCFFCRRDAAIAFASAFSASDERQRAPVIDRILHSERWASGGVSQAPIGERLLTLPDGSFVRCGDVSYALRGIHAMPWSPGGYGPPITRQALLDDDVWLITPPSTCRALAAGYAPAWHVSCCGKK